MKMDIDQSKGFHLTCTGAANIGVMVRDQGKDGGDLEEGDVKEGGVVVGKLKDKELYDESTLVIIREHVVLPMGELLRDRLINLQGHRQMSGNA